MYYTTSSQSLLLAQREQPAHSSILFRYDTELNTDDPIPDKLM